MNLQFNVISFKKHIILCTFLLLSIFTTHAQEVPFLQSVYESNEDISGVAYTEGYIYWEEYINNKNVLYRLHNNNISSSQFPETYSECTGFAGWYNYGDFMYFEFINNFGTFGIEGCEDRGFLWEGDNEIKEIPSIGIPCTGYENLIFMEDFRNVDIYDINTQTLTPINISTEVYRYSATNICSMNDTYIKIKAIKYDRTTGERLGNAIVFFNWQRFHRR